jgi:DNA polymerase
VYNQYLDREIEQIYFYGVALGNKWTEQTTYGGMLTENITQAVARDLLADAIVRCEKASYPIVMSVHDELVAEVPKSFGSVEEFEHILCDNDPWAEGIPVVAEGWRGTRYRK